MDRSVVSLLQRFAPWLLFGSMSALLIWSALRSAQAEVDEPGWIASGFLTLRLATDGAPRERWAAAYDDPRINAFGNINPPFGKYLFGAVVAVLRDRNDPVDYGWLWPHDYDWNLAAGNIPPPRLLAGVRVFIALVATTCLVLVWRISAELMPRGTWHPLVASVLLFLHPAFRHCATRVYTDIPQMCLSLAAIWLILVWWRRRNTVALLAGLVTIGLACATKFSAGSLAVLTGIAVCLVPAPLAVRTWRAAASGLVPVFVFVAVNPYLWRHPVADTLELLQRWSDSRRDQQADPALAADAVLGRSTACRLVFERTCLPGVPVGQGNALGMVAKGLVAATVTFVGLAALVARGVSARRRTRSMSRQSAVVIAATAAVASMLAVAVVPLRWLAASLNVAGSVRIIRHLVRHRQCDGMAYFGIVYAGTVVATVLWLPFDWGRYYMPVLGLTTIVASLGVMEFQESLSLFRLGTNATEESGPDQR